MLNVIMRCVYGTARSINLPRNQNPKNLGRLGIIQELHILRICAKWIEKSPNYRILFRWLSGALLRQHFCQNLFLADWGVSLNSQGGVIRVNWLILVFDYLRAPHIEGNEEYQFIGRSVSPFVDEADWIGSLDGDYARDSLAYWQENVYLMFVHLFC